MACPSSSSSSPSRERTVPAHWSRYTSVKPSVRDPLTTPQQHHVHHLAMEPSGETRRDCVLRSLKKSPLVAMERPDSRFYSGRNPVPRMQGSLWELVPDIGSSSDSDHEDLDRRKKRLAKTKEVWDPITRRNISVCDAKYAPPPEPIKKPPVSHPPESWRLFMEELRALTMKYIIFVITIFIFFNGCLSLPFSLSVLAAIGGGVTWWRNVNSVWADILHEVQISQGLDRVNGPEGNESAEWLNGTIAKLWPQINADLFGTIVDLIEDVMQASIPSFVNEVKVTNVGQGTRPIRIISLRWLREEEAPGGTTDSLGEQEEVGEWACLEVTFAYRAGRSGASAASKAKNANLLVHLTLGLKGVVATPIPVWVELRGCTGTCRVKIQLIPDPPFVKLATFTFLGMPRIEIAAVPLNQRFFNVMNLPVISDFINCSIRTAAAAYVAPANYTLDVSKILVGSDSKDELLAIGVLVVHIHSAVGIIAADINGKSDCYVTLSYSKFTKPLWSTRIIFADLNPVWDETAVLIVNADEVKAGEMLSVTIWDSDRFTADDIVGRTDISVTELVRNRGQVYKKQDRLKGLEGEDMPGRVNWSVVFHGKQELNPALATSGVDERLPRDFKDAEDFLPAEIKAKSSVPESRVSIIPPDPDYPSGILSIQIHNIVALARHSVTGSKRDPSSRNGQSAPTVEEEECENLPSPYCSIILDQTKIYKTRVKPMTSKPFFNAGTERFVRDFRASTVLIAVSDSRLREIDPLLGVVEFRLKDVLQNSSMISRYYPLQGGIGFGKIRVSLLFRSISAQLPRQLLASDTGTLEFVSTFISADHITDPTVRAADYITFAMPLGSRRAPRVTATDTHGWRPAGVRLGVRHRHAVPCILYFRRESKLRHDKTHAAAVMWLKDLPDDEDTALSLDVFQPNDMDTFVQNCAGGRPPGRLVGHVDVVVRFRRGIAPWPKAHRRAAEEDRDFADVIHAERCVVRNEHPPDSESEDDESAGSETEAAPEEEEREEHDGGETHTSNGETPAVGLKHRLSRRRDAQKELHRHERGLMQWKGARTLAWVGRGVKDAGKGVKGHFKMEPRKPNVETEA